MYAIITENDVSMWEDRTGEAYHFPKRYIKYLQPGTQVVYYKGGIKDKSYSDKRLSDAPHYFGIATIAKHYPDPKSEKGDVFSFIENFKSFENAVPNKVNDEYIEVIPESRRLNYWRDGVRQIDKVTYDRILALAKLSQGHQTSTNPKEDVLNDADQRFESGVEGNKTLVLTTKYERDPKLRKQAVLIHGDSCKVCGFNFGEAYGEHGLGYIHVHHIKPISTAGGSITVNPETDLIPLCANCHAMIHRRKDVSISLEDLSKILNNKVL